MPEPFVLVMASFVVVFDRLNLKQGPSFTCWQVSHNRRSHSHTPQNTETLSFKPRKPRLKKYLKLQT